MHELKITSVGQSQFHSQQSTSDDLPIPPHLSRVTFWLVYRTYVFTRFMIVTFFCLLTSMIFLLQFKSHSLSQ